MKNFNKKYIVGIDPSIQEANNGFALYDTSKAQLITVRATSDISIVPLCLEVVADFGGDINDFVFVVENSSLETNIFGAWVNFKKLLFAQFRQPLQNWNLIESTFRAALALGTAVGKNQYASMRIIRELQNKGMDIVEISPSWRDRADTVKTIGGVRSTNPAAFNMPTKTTAEQFKKITGYTETTNEHGRDAAMLIYGKTALSIYTFATMMQKVKRTAAKATVKPKTKTKVKPKTK